QRAVQGDLRRRRAEPIDGAGAAGVQLPGLPGPDRAREPDAVLRHLRARHRSKRLEVSLPLLRQRHGLLMNAREAAALEQRRAVCARIGEATSEQLNCALIDYIAAVRATDDERARAAEPPQLSFTEE